MISATIAATLTPITTSQTSAHAASKTRLKFGPFHQQLVTGELSTAGTAPFRRWR